MGWRQFLLTNSMFWPKCSGLPANTAPHIPTVVHAAKDTQQVSFHKN